jgi:formate C-acetyltransferase
VATPHSNEDKIMGRAIRLSRRAFLEATGAGLATAAIVSVGGRRAGAVPVSTPHAEIAALRREIVNSPVGVALHRAKVFTQVFQQTEGKPWIVRKALALREYFQTVPLYLREHDRLAGSISERPGAMPVMVELGIGENNIYTSENPQRKGYLKGQVPHAICDYWKNRNLWGQYRTEILGLPPVEHADEVPQELAYKFLSNQGHLSPSYGELLRTGLAGVLRTIQGRRSGETDPAKLAFLTAAENTLAGLSEWIRRYAEYLASQAKGCGNSARAVELSEMSQIAARVAADPPATFREALQLAWFVHQAIHIEGHGYSCTPDRLDQLLFPFYEADRKAGRLDDDGAVRLLENFVLKMYDNTFWGPEHHLTQGLCAGGSTPDGIDQTNRLSWLVVEAATNLSLPEPLVWIRWHPKIDQAFFDFCLGRLARSTCFPMLWSDKAVPAALMELGLSRDDAFNYVPVGCNELAVPGQMYFNPGAHVSYLQAIEAALTDGKGYRGQWKWKNVAPPARNLATFDQFAAAVGAYMRRSIEPSYQSEMKTLEAQMRWGQTPLTSCFFDGCIDKAQDLTQGTKYNVLSCGGIAFANAVDCLAAIREVDHLGAAILQCAAPQPVADGRNVRVKVVVGGEIDQHEHALIGRSGEGDLRRRAAVIVRLAAVRGREGGHLHLIAASCRQPGDRQRRAQFVGCAELLQRRRGRLPGHDRFVVTAILRVADRLPLQEDAIRGDGGGAQVDWGNGLRLLPARRGGIDAHRHRCAQRREQIVVERERGQVGGHVTELAGDGAAQRVVVEAQGSQRG